jgi:hypothetical protein
VGRLRCFEFRFDGEVNQQSNQPSLFAWRHCSLAK